MDSLFEVEMRAEISKKVVADFKLKYGDGSVSIEEDKYYRYIVNPSPSWIVRTRKKGSSYFLTYKSNNKEEGSWSEVEIQIPGEKVNQLGEFYLENGFNLDVEIEKTRHSYQVDNMTVNIDEISKLGIYIEAEIMSLEKDIESNKAKINEFLQSLGILKEKITQKGYVSLIKEKNGKI